MTGGLLGTAAAGSWSRRLGWVLYPGILPWGMGILTVKVNTCPTPSMTQFVFISTLLRHHKHHPSKLRFTFICLKPTLLYSPFVTGLTKPEVFSVAFSCYSFNHPHIRTDSQFRGSPASASKGLSSSHRWILN